MTTAIVIADRCLDALSTRSSDLRPFAWIRGLIQLEPAQVRYELQDLVAGLDRLRVELESALRRDQVDQLLHRLDVRASSEFCRNCADAVGARVCHPAADPEASVSA